MERYPRQYGVVDSSISSYEIFFLLDKKTDQVATQLMCFQIRKSKIKMNYAFKLLNNLTIGVGAKNI